MIFLLCDHIQQQPQASFSNAARRAYTQIKKATLLGGMGTKTGIPNLKELAILKNKKLESIKEVSRLKGDSLQKVFLGGESNNIKNINNKIQAAQPKRSYVDAAQIARRGSITPIKSKSYIDRSGYITNPQDNTVLAGTLNKIEKQTKKSGKEQGTMLYKDKGKLKAARISEGNEYSVDPSKNLPKGKQALIDIHSHPSLLRGKARPTPSIPDLNDKPALKGRTSLIISADDKKRLITKYKTGDEDKLWDFRNLEGKSGYAKAVRSTGADYKVITPRTKQ